MATCPFRYFFSYVSFHNLVTNHISKQNAIISLWLLCLCVNFGKILCTYMYVRLLHLPPAPPDVIIKKNSAGTIPSFRYPQHRFSIHVKNQVKQPLNLERYSPDSQVTLDIKHHIFRFNNIVDAVPYIVFDDDKCKYHRRIRICVCENPNEKENNRFISTNWQHSSNKSFP